MIKKGSNMTETIFIDAIEGAKVAVFKGAGNMIRIIKIICLIASKVTT